MSAELSILYSDEAWDAVVTSAWQFADTVGFQLNYKESQKRKVPFCWQDNLSLSNSTSDLTVAVSMWLNYYALNNRLKEEVRQHYQKKHEIYSHHCSVLVWIWLMQQTNCANCNDIWPGERQTVGSVALVSANLWPTAGRLTSCNLFAGPKWARNTVSGLSAAYHITSYYRMNQENILEAIACKVKA